MSSKLNQNVEIIFAYTLPHLTYNKGYLNKLEEISENSFLYGTQKTSTATKYMCVLEKYALMLSIETAIFKNQVVNNTILKTNYPNVELKVFAYLSLLLIDKLVLSQYLLII